MRTGLIVMALMLFAVTKVEKVWSAEVCIFPCRAMTVALEEAYSGLKEAGDFDEVEVIGCDPETKDMYILAVKGEKSAYAMVPYDKDCNAGEPQLVTDFDRIKKLLRR